VPVFHFLDQAASLCRSALHHLPRRYSHYRQVAEYTDRIASACSSSACTGGAPGHLHANCPEFVLAYFGILKPGRWSRHQSALHPPEIIRQVNDAGVKTPYVGEPLRTHQNGTAGNRHPTVIVVGLGNLEQVIWI